MLKDLKCVYLLILVLGLFKVIFAEGGNLPDAVTVFDLSNINENGNIIPKIYLSQNPNKISTFLKIATDKNWQAKYNDIYDILNTKFEEVEVADCTRWISKKNQRIDIYVYYRENNKIDGIKIIEDKRESRISGDIKSLFQIIPSAGGKALNTQKIYVYNKHYFLEKARGKIKISVNMAKSSSNNNGQEQFSYKKEDGQRQLPSKPRASIDEKPEPAEGLYIELITGGSEHFFLTADVPVFSIKDAKFVDNKNSGLGIAPKDTPKSVFIGLNVQVADVVKESIIKPPYLKFMLQFSNTPFDVFGVGLGWNFPKIEFLEKLGFKTNAICLFGGIYWAKESDSNGQENNHRYQWRWGLSYDLSKISDWFKK
jgi:hypothetical protein